MSVEKYTSLITSEHNKKPNFMKVVEVNTKFYAHVQDILSGFINDFDIDSAVGAQLDTIGLWAGVSRFIKSPLTGIYFEWGAASVGWSSGIWQGDFSPTSGLTSLPDDIYRTLIRAKIAANSWDGTIPEAYKIWENIFNDNIVIIQDNQNMSITVAVVGAVLDALTRALLTGGYIPLKPEGVRVDYYAIPVDTNPIFIWGGEGSDVAGWGEGSWAQLITPT